jgi:glycosyltransferase involved in cell wall biosynthesis
MLSSPSELKKPLVSIIIIFLNAERFIEEAIQSIVAQTYDDWEILLVDDGSSDNSATLALELSRHFPQKVTYLEHEGHANRGMSASRNLGITHAQGDFIAFLNADDVWLPQKLEQQLQILQDHPEAVMVYGPWQYWFSWANNSLDPTVDVVQPMGSVVDRVVAPPQLMAPLLESRWVPIPSGILIKKETTLQVEGFEDDFRGHMEDHVFWSKIFLSFPVFVSSKCWYQYRMHPNSATARRYQEGKCAPLRLIFYRWLKRYFQKIKFQDRKIWLLFYTEVLSNYYAIFSRKTHMRKALTPLVRFLKLLFRLSIGSNLENP